MISILSVITTIEDGGKNWPPRFEYEWFLNHAGAITPVIANARTYNGNCSWTTARMLCATSWGKYQVMGFNLYSPPLFQHSVETFLLDENGEQEKYVMDFLARHDINFSVDELRSSEDARRQFATRYNGPGNVDDYATRIEGAIARLDAQGG